MSQVKLKRLLTTRLALSKPRFKLGRARGMVHGSVISVSFYRKDSGARQRMLRQAVYAELGKAAGDREVGTLLAYTPAEWAD